MKEGWIKIHRQILDWEWYDDIYAKHVFLHLLLTANTEDKKWRGVTVKRGQVVVSLRKLAERLGISIRTLRTTLQKLKATHEVTHQATHQFSIITICKYENYQCTKTQSDTPSDTPSDTRPTQTKEYKNNITTSSTTAGAYARVSVNDEVAELREDKTWKEAVCMSRHLSPEQVDAYLSGFLVSCMERGTVRHDNLTDAKRHFADWLNIKMQKENESDRTTRQHDTRRRGGIVVTSTGSYEGAF